MRLGVLKPGLLTSFVDAFSEDVLLQVTTDAKGSTMVSYTLYDARGDHVASSDGLEVFLTGREIRDSADELLLLIPSQPDECFEYRLYSRRGTLLTSSDGMRTQLFGGIRVDSVKYPAPVKPPFTPRAPRTKA